MTKPINLKIMKNKKLEDHFNRSMKELRKVFGINWVYNTPSFLVVEDRQTMDALEGRETPKWKVGYNMGRDAIVILGPKNYERDSIHKYSDEDMRRLIKHELCHAFYSLAAGNHHPRWLTEGLSLNLADEVDRYAKVEVFKDFIESDKNYREWAWAVKVLIDKYGIDKIIEFVKSLKEVSDDDFSKHFENFFGSKLSYKNFNKLLNI